MWNRSRVGVSRAGTSIRSSDSPLRSARVTARRAAARGSVERNTHHDISTAEKQQDMIVPHSPHSPHSTRSTHTSANSCSITAAESTPHRDWSPCNLHVSALTATVAIGLLEAATARPGVAAEAALDGVVPYHAQLLWQVRHPLARTGRRAACVPALE